MADVQIVPAVPSGRPAPSGIPGKIDGYLYDQPKLIEGGTDGQSVVADAASATGAIWAHMVPATPVTNFADIPVGQARLYLGGSPLKFGLVYNDGATYHELTITLP